MANLSDLFPPSGNTFPIYDPGMMVFDGSTGYYNKTTGFSVTGNKVTVLLSFNASTFTGNKYVNPFTVVAPQDRVTFYLFSSDYSTDTAMQSKLQVYVSNSSGTGICKLRNSVDILDGNDHVIMFSFDGDNGSAYFYIDGVNADDTGWGDRVAPTTGTLPTTGPDIGVGAFPTGANYFPGSIGFCGYADAYLTNWSDFFDSNNNPIKQDETTWSNSGWGSQPLFWNENGDMLDNKGSAGNMTRNGTIVVADVAEVTATDYGYSGPGNIFPIYDPGMMQFDGSTGYYNKNGFSWTGNKCTVMFRFKRASFTGDVYEGVVCCYASSGTRQRPTSLIISSDYSSLPNRRGKLQFQVHNSTGTVICLLISKNSVLDDEEHTALFSFDGDNGTASFIIDGVNADDTSNADRVAPTTGTLATATGQVEIGQLGGANYFGGQLGFIGIEDSYLTNWSDFMDSDGNPIKQDETTWSNSGWGSQPLYWNENGDMLDNKGSAGNMTRNGTVTVADVEEVTATDYGLGPAYQPALMQFDGSTGYYKATGFGSTSFTKLSFVCRFNCDALTNNHQVIAYAFEGGLRATLLVAIVQGDDANNPDKLWLRVQNSSGTTICNLYSTSTIVAGQTYAVVFNYDGTAGTADFLIDGTDEDNTSATGRTLTTGTIATGATNDFATGASVSAGDKFDGAIGFCGYAGGSDLTYSDFFDSNNNPIDQDETTWSNSGWGSQPLFWNEHGDMLDNKGSAGNMTRNGTVVVAPL